MIVFSRFENQIIISVLQIVHGMAEYIDRYDNFAKYMTEHGFNVIGHDHLGHGHSVSDERDYGFFAEENGDKIIIEDMHSVTQYAREKWEELPNFILGHSMGSFCLRQYLTKYSNDVFGAIIIDSNHWRLFNVLRRSLATAPRFCSMGD